MQSHGDLKAVASSSSLPPEPQSQSAGTRPRTYTKADWNDQKDTIKHLYCDKGKKLHEVVDHFRRHGFFATEKQFKDRIKAWGFDKKIKMREMKAIIRKRRMRRQLGKETIFEVRGRLVEEANINRASARYGSSSGSPCPATPPEVICYTPPQELSPRMSAVDVVNTVDAQIEPSSPVNKTSRQPSPKYPTIQIPVTPPAAPPNSSYTYSDTSRGVDSASEAQSWGSAPNSSASSFHTPSTSHIDPRYLQNDPIWPDFDSESFGPLGDEGLPSINIERSKSTSENDIDFTQFDFSDSVQYMPLTTESTPLTPVESQLFPPASSNLQPVPSDFGPLATSSSPTPQKRYKEDEEDELSLKFDLLHVTHGIHHAETINTLDNLTTVLKAQGRYTTAEALSEQVERASNQHFGRSHRASLSATCSRLDALACQGRYNTVQSEVEVLLMRSKNLLGPHDDVTVCISSLWSKVLYATGKYQQAEFFAKQVYNSDLGRLGPRHASTLASKAFWAVVLLTSNRVPEAIIKLQEVLHDSDTKDEMLLLDRKGDLAYAYAVHRLYRESEKLEREVLQGQVSLLGPDHPNTLKTIVRLARTLHLQKNHLDAKTILVDVLNRQLKVLTVGSKEINITYMEIGKCLVSMGKRQEAEVYFERSRNIVTGYDTT